VDSGRLAPSGVVKIYKEPDACQVGYWAKALGDIIKHDNNKRSSLDFIIMVPQKEFDLRCNLPKAVGKNNTYKIIISNKCLQITYKTISFSNYYDSICHALNGWQKLANGSGFVLCLLPSLPLKHNH
jgi:hypothetical protein